MKNTIIISAFLLGGLAGWAQEDDGADFTSKRGVKIKPESGEFGIGFNAVPMFNYLGNMFNGDAGNNVLNTSYFVNSDNMIYGKYFLEDDMAIRGRVRLRDANSKYRNLVVEQGQNDQNVKVEDLYIRNDQLLEVGGGVEMRRGKGRVQGVYGAEVSLSTGKVMDNYTWGNEMVEPHIAPETTTNFITGTSANMSNRLISQDFGRTRSIGVNAFVGIEYAFAPKIAIAAEFTWGVAWSKTKQNSTVTQKYTDKVEEEEVVNEGARFITVDTGNYGGAIALLFYF